MVIVSVRDSTYIDAGKICGLDLGLVFMAKMTKICVFGCVLHLWRALYDKFIIVEI